MSRPASEQYFAALPRADLGKALVARISDFYEYQSKTQRFEMIQKSFAIENGCAVDGTGNVAYEISRAGEQGEEFKAFQNHYYSIGTSVVNLTTAQRPAVAFAAANSDKASLSQTRLADGLSEYHLVDRGLEGQFKAACASAVFESEGFLMVLWNANAGEPVAVGGDEAQMDALLDGQQDPSAPPPPVVKAGEPEITNLGPLDVIRDEHARSWDALTWLIVRTPVSRWDLVARYPEQAGKIRKAPSKPEADKSINFGGRGQDDTDLVYLYRFFHKTTDAVPEGREVWFLTDETILLDGPMPYRKLPVYREAPDEIRNSPFGKTPMFNLLGPQDVLNEVRSALITAALGHGVNNYSINGDSKDISMESIGSSSNILKLPPGVTIEPLQRAAIPSEFFQIGKDEVATMEVLSGINSVVRGNPSEQVGADSSGAKLALIEAQAVKNNSGLEKSHADLVRDVILALIHCYRDFGQDTRRMVRIAGKANGYMIQDFVASDLNDIDRVKVDLGNPMMRTPTGKMTIADKAVELGLIKPGDLQKYIMLIRDGTVDPLFEAEESEQMLIRGENERLMDGGAHAAIVSDDHVRHAREHRALLNNPALREPTPENQATQAAVLAAIQQHVDMFQSATPAMVLMTSSPETIGLWQQLQQMMSPPPMPPGQSQTPPPAPGEPSQTPPPMSPEQAEPEQPSMPNMPTNPSLVDQGALPQ